MSGGLGGVALRLFFRSHPLQTKASGDLAGFQGILERMPSFKAHMSTGLLEAYKLA